MPRQREEGRSQADEQALRAWGSIAGASWVGLHRNTVWGIMHVGYIKQTYRPSATGPGMPSIGFGRVWLLTSTRRSFASFRPHTPLEQ